FGSGVARKVPDGFPAEKARLQLLEFLLMAGDYAAKHSVIIAIELKRSYCHQDTKTPRKHQE
ncbi:MAG: hypothetical protein QME64_07605, partial [bacterium]|nr:hypothetical protein [bacterium]